MNKQLFKRFANGRQGLLETHRPERPVVTAGTFDEIHRYAVLFQNSHIFPHSGNGNGPVCGSALNGNGRKNGRVALLFDQRHGTIGIGGRAHGISIRELGGILERII